LSPASPRTPYIAGNWKMNLDQASGLDLVQAIREHTFGKTNVDVAIFPPAVYLSAMQRACEGSSVIVGAQNLCEQDSGAFTGETSASMLRDLGVSSTLVGHSERRHVYGESDTLCGAKVRAALAAGLDVVLCIGETQAEREDKQTEPVCSRQLATGLEGVSTLDMSRITIAYEPVWAIGTGLTATPEMAGETHAYVRGVLGGLHSEATAQATRILYGGSVKPDNAADLLAVPDIDGALVGGASLKAELFLPIIDGAR